MCTVSWLPTSQGYELFFNRDEQRTRAVAWPPEIAIQSGVSTLMPRDPVGEGSWIAVNEFGMSLCLLNFYQGDVPAGPLLSRGQLVREFSHLSDQRQVSDQLADTDLSRYAPFTLIALATDSEGKDAKPRSNPACLCVIGYQWNGHLLTTLRPESPVTSSSVKFNEVVESRFNAYAAKVQAAVNQMVASDPREQAGLFIDYHSSHEGEKNHRSVCMHRDDAKTVSFSHIRVDRHKIIFSYHPDSPCAARQPLISELNRIW